jgi:hypothetical protein
MNFYVTQFPKNCKIDKTLVDMFAKIDAIFYFYCLSWNLRCKKSLWSRILVPFLGEFSNWIHFESRPLWLSRTLHEIVIFEVCPPTFLETLCVWPRKSFPSFHLTNSKWRSFSAVDICSLKLLIQDGAHFWKDKFRFRTFLKSFLLNFEFLQFLNRRRHLERKASHEQHLESY